MKTKLVFEIDDLNADNLFYCADPENEDNLIFATDDPEGVAKQLKIPLPAVKAIENALHDFSESLIEKLHEDLKDLHDAISGA